MRIVKKARIYAQNGGGGGYSVFEVVPEHKYLCKFVKWGTAMDWLLANGYEWYPVGSI